MQDGNGARAVPPTASHGPLHRLIELFNSVWLGIILASLLFLFCSIGSAVPMVRQLPALEMTEFEWFHWWPFDVLVALFCVNIVVVTLRRIPLRWVNAGVWTIHTGIVTLTLGSYLYFGTKVEGDAPVFRRQVTIEMPGMAEPGSLVVLPGSETSVVVGPDEWRFAIQSTNTDWPILSAGHEGETAYSVNVAVTPPVGEPFIRQLLDGYPQFIEDILPGKGRAIKSLGRKLVNEDLKLSLGYAPTTTFHVMKSWALFIRRVGETEWVERPIAGLPRYNDRIGSRDLVSYNRDEPLPLRSIDLTVPPGPTPDAFGDTPLRVTSYLRYAHMERRWRDGGSQLNPVIQFSAQSGNGTSRQYELIALDREHNRLEGGEVEFRWADSLAAIEAMPISPTAMLHVEVPATKASFDVPVDGKTVVGRTGDFTPIEGTDFSYRILLVQDNLVIPSSSGVVSVAMVEIKTPDGSFTRMVADKPEMTRDMKGDSGDPHAPSDRTAGAADPRVTMTYTPGSSPLVFVAHPAGLRLLFKSEGAEPATFDMVVGQTVQVMPGLSLRVDSLLTRALVEHKPSIVPDAQRRPDARVAFSMIRLEADSPSGPVAKWLQFNQYAMPDARFAYPGRFTYQREHFPLPDGTVAEVLFSRERRELPNPIALEDFELDTHHGGYMGSVSGIRNYVSRLRFLDDGKWTEPNEISVNAPTGFGGYWYFQSTWDPPRSGAAGTGMNFTGLGIGNRNGVYVQLFGCCLSVAGMIFAFYVKPVIKRRRQERQCAKIGAGGEAESDDAMAGTATEPVSV